MQGAMKVTSTLRDAHGGTEILIARRTVAWLPQAANTTGAGMALERLAALVEPR